MGGIWCSWTLLQIREGQAKETYERAPLSMRDCHQGVGKIVPVDNEFGASDKADKAANYEGWYCWWDLQVLSLRYLRVPNIAEVIAVCGSFIKVCRQSLGSSAKYIPKDVVTGLTCAAQGSHQDKANASESC